MIIYKATNRINGLSYIGQTIQPLEYRIKKHFNGKKTYFSNALNKNGEESFDWIVLEECKSKDELDEREKYYIAKFDTMRPNGYNLTLGGDGGTLGYRHTKESIKKMSKPKSKEHKEKLSKLAKGRRLSKETRRKISKFMSERNKGNKHSKETRRKISEKAKLRVGKLNPNYGNIGKKSKLFNKSSRDYIWKIIYPDGERIEVDSIKKFCREYTEETGIKLFQSNFCHMRNGELKQYKGFRLEL